MRRIGAVILAAGESARLGRPKQLVEIDGVALLRRAAQSAIDAGCQPVVVVLGAFADSFREVLRDLEINIVINARWRNGMGSSIVAGVDAVKEKGVDAVLLMVCDQPKVDVLSLQRLIAAFVDRRIVASSYDDTLGTPAIFAAKYFPSLCELSGEHGAKNLIRRHGAEVIPVAMPEAAVDIDSADDLGVT